MTGGLFVNGGNVGGLYVVGTAGGPYVVVELGFWRRGYLILEVCM